MLNKNNVMKEHDSKSDGQDNNIELPQFDRKKMVDWYSPTQLATTGVRAVISGIFGNYADKREIQAALASNQQALQPFDFSDREELYIDYTSDLGSGWDSTYSVAYLLGREVLKVTDQSRKAHDLKRGNILVMGGDEVYPTATPEEYKNRLVGPYTTSLPYVNEEDDPPTLFAIPGNHDWYDGLSSFIKLFCQQRWIGGWQTRQDRSYFAAKLPHNWWLWGIDIQLSADLDKPQIDYFDEMHKQASEGDKIILCTSEPSWVYQNYQPDDKPFRNLQFFTNRYTSKKQKKLDFRLMLTGDMHHYASYKNKDKENPDWKITAGGGGAFTHPTHQLPEKLDLPAGTYQREGIYPDENESRKMALNNLRFPFINLRFGALFAVLYMLFGWFVGAADASAITDSGSFLSLLAASGLSDFTLIVNSFLSLLAGSPGLFIFLFVLFSGMVAFADTNRKKPLGSWIAGAIHGLVQVILLMSAMWLTCYLVFGVWQLGTQTWAGIALSALVLALCGWLFSGFAMGIYLMSVNLILKIHETEAFSAFRGKDYKNFVRLNLDEDGLTVYPIKISKACREWKNNKEKSGRESPLVIPKSKEDLKAELIEGPHLIM